MVVSQNLSTVPHCRTKGRQRSIATGRKSVFKRRWGLKAAKNNWHGYAVYPFHSLLVHHLVVTPSSVGKRLLFACFLKKMKRLTQGQPEVKARAEQPQHPLLPLLASPLTRGVPTSSFACPRRLLSLGLTEVAVRLETKSSSLPVSELSDLEMAQAVWSRKADSSRMSQSERPKVNNASSLVKCAPGETAALCAKLSGLSLHTNVKSTHLHASTYTSRPLYWKWDKNWCKRPFPILFNWQ